MKLSEKIIFILVMNCLLYAKNENCEQKKFEETIYDWSRSIAEVFHLVNSKSYFPTPDQGALIKLLDAFVHNQDDHSHFLGPQEYTSLIKATQGNFYGIGIILAPKRTNEEFLVVLDILPGKPAALSGIQKFDKIIAIDGMPVSSLSMEEAIDKLKSNKRYSTVTLDIIRDKKKALSIQVKRDLIEEEHAICYYLPEQQTLYCALTTFSHKVAAQLENAIKRALPRTFKSLILDLRDNSGGIVQAAVDCASLFLKKKTLIVSTKDRHGTIIDQAFTEKDPIVPEQTFIMILVNEYTASAAEILAKALQLYSQNHNQKKITSPYIFIVGMQTFGKGSIQEIIPMANNCALKLTTCLYYLPDNSCIHAKGVTPNFVIEQKYPPTAEMKLFSRLYGKERTKSDSTQKQDPQEDFKDLKNHKLENLKADYQLQMTLNLLALLTLAYNEFPHLVNTYDKAYKWLLKHYNYTNIGEIQEIK